MTALPPVVIQQRLVVFAFSAAALTTLASLVWEPLTNFVLPAAILLYFVSSLVFSPRFIQIAAGVMITVGLLLLTTVADARGTWGEGLNRSAGMFILFCAIPLLTEMFTSLTGQTRTYERGRNETKQRRIPPFVGATGTQFVLSLVMSIGALWITGPLFEKQGLDATTSHRGMSLGYAMNVTSSPFDVVVHTALLLSGITYVRFIGGAAVVILWYVIIFVPVEYLRNRRSEISDERTGHHNETGRLVSRALLANLGVLFLVAIVGTAVFPDLPSATVIGILGGAYGLAWLLRTRGTAAGKQTLHLVGNAIPKYSGFLPLLIAASFLGTVLPESPLSLMISTIVETVAEFPVYFGVLFIIAATVILAVFGVHMMVTIVIFGSVFTPEVLGLTPLGFSLALIVAYVSAMNISPLVPFTALVATVTGCKNPLTVVRHVLLPWVIVVTVMPLILMWGFSL